MGTLSEQDPAIAEAIRNEQERQRLSVVLIASENYASRSVLEAQGSVMTNKYAEGYPGRRYYAGCDFVDAAEQAAIDRARELFGAQHVNVQPHAGAQANMAGYSAVLEPGATVMGLRLDQGGHLTHGSPVNFSSKLYRFVAYGLDRETEQIDYAEVLRLAHEHLPKLIVAGYTAYSRTIDFERFGAIAREVGALLMVDMAHIAGLIAAGVHPSPVGHADIITSTTHKTLRGPRGAILLSTSSLQRAVDRSVFPFTQGGPMMHSIAAKAVCFREAMQPEFKDYGRRVVENAQALAATLEGEGARIVSGGTDNHLMLVDLSPLGCTGQEAEEALSRAGIVANKNAIPNDRLPPRITSGLRLGTAAVTTRGFGVEEMGILAQLIMRTITQRGSSRAEAAVRNQARDLASQFPLPGVDD